MNDKVLEDESFLSLYPNPNNGNFYIEVDSRTEGNVLIELFSINGKLLNTFKATNKVNLINESSLPDGMYLINTRSKSFKSPIKMILQK